MIYSHDGRIFFDICIQVTDRGLYSCVIISCSKIIRKVRLTYASCYGICDRSFKSISYSDKSIPIIYSDNHDQSIIIFSFSHSSRVSDIGGKHSNIFSLRTRDDQYSHLSTRLLHKTKNLTFQILFLLLTKYAHGISYILIIHRDIKSSRTPYYAHQKNQQSKYFFCHTYRDKYKLYLGKLLYLAALSS